MGFFKILNRILNFGYIRYIAPVYCLFTISYLSFSDLSDIHSDEINIPYIDKFVHFIMYLILAYILLVTKLLNNKRYHLHVLIFCIFYGIFTEIMQHYGFTYRAGDVVDFLFDLLGILIAFLIFERTKLLTN
jgi:VanZ family protein